jgi:hypothetical protein
VNLAHKVLIGCAVYAFLLLVLAWGCARQKR